MKKLLFVFVLVFCISFVFASSVSPAYLKSSVKVGEEHDVSLDFSCEEDCEIKSYGNFFSLSKYSGSNNFESNVFFEDVSEGVYVGSVVVEESVVPVVLEVNSENLDFVVTLDVSSADKEVELSKTIFPKINLFNLKGELMNVVVSTYVYDLKGNILFFCEDNFSISDKYSYVKLVSVSDDFLLEGYVFAVTAKSKSGTAVSSYSFNVVQEKRFNFNFDNRFFIFIVIIILILILGVVFYMFYERRTFLSQLRKKQAFELKFYAKKIKEKEMEALARVKTEGGKVKVQKEFSDARKKIFGEMKKEYLKQKEEIKKIKLKKKSLSEKDILRFNKSVYNKALKSSTIAIDLKSKLGTLERAYDEGFISKDSLSKGKMRINREHGKLKRNVYK